MHIANASVTGPIVQFGDQSSSLGTNRPICRRIVQFVDQLSNFVPIIQFVEQSSNVMTNCPICGPIVQSVDQ